MYRHCNPNNIYTFFDEATASRSKAAMKYENITLMEDVNTDTKNEILGFGKLHPFCGDFQPYKLGSIRKMFNEKPYKSLPSICY